jgi:hypothetical protein
VGSDAPALLTVELFDNAQRPLQRKAEAVGKMDQPTSRRSWLRTLVTCGACELGMVCIRQLSGCKQYQYRSYACQGHAPLTVGRATTCTANRGRADRLDEVVWQALCQWLRHPHVLPHLHQAWADAKPQHLSALEAPLSQRLQRQPRRERQDQRVLDAYQAEVPHLSTGHHEKISKFA